MSRRNRGRILPGSDAMMSLTMEPDGIIRMEIYDPLGKRVIFPNPSKSGKEPYADMEKAISQTIQVIINAKKNNL